MSVLFVSGVNDRSVLGVDINSKGELAYLMDGNCSVFGRLPLVEGMAHDYVLFGKGVQQRGISFNEKPRLIFNQISDPDTHRGSLERCVELCDQVRTQVINHPQYVLNTARDHVADALQGIDGVIMPKCWRFQPKSPDEVFAAAKAHGLQPPFIVRLAGEHHGRAVVRCDDMEDQTQLHALPFDGRDFYLMEYRDYRDSEGFYHKQRVVVINGEPFLRHSMYFNQWAVHSDARAFMLEREEWEDDIKRFGEVIEPRLEPLRPAIQEIARRLKLEYFGIDCHLGEDGTMLIFEANANMNILHSPNPKLRYRVERIEKALHGLISSFSPAAVP